MSLILLALVLKSFASVLAVVTREDAMRSAMRTSDVLLKNLFGTVLLSCSALARWYALLAVR